MSAVDHVVLTRLKPSLGGGRRDELRKRVRALGDEISAVDGLSEGPSVSDEGLEAGFDSGFVLRFSSRRDLDTYLVHPAHQAFAAELGVHASPQVRGDRWAVRCPSPSCGLACSRADAT